MTPAYLCIPYSQRGNDEIYPSFLIADRCFPSHHPCLHLFLSFSYSHVGPWCSQNSFGNFWDGVPAVFVVNSHHPLIRASPHPPAVPFRMDCQDSAGLEAILLLMKHLADFKHCCSLWSVTGFSSVSAEPGLRLTVLRAFVLPCLCLLCFILQRIGYGGLCSSAEWDFLEMRDALWIKTMKERVFVLWLISRKVKSSPQQVLGMRYRLQYKCVPSWILNVLNNESSVTISHECVLKPPSASLCDLTFKRCIVQISLWDSYYC